MPAALQTTTREGSFASTRWTVVHQAADSQTASQHALSALSELCQIYWRPVYVFLRRHGIPQHDAQDLTQGFFADLIESRAYARADPRKGRFRSFLLGTLKHFLAHARDRDRAQKRGRGTAGRRRVAVPRNSAARIYRSSSGVRCDALVKRGMTIRDLICWIVAWSPASYANELGVFDFALVALPNERKTSTNGGTLAPASLDEGACFVKAFEGVMSDT